MSSENKLLYSILDPMLSNTSYTHPQLSKHLPVVLGFLRESSLMKDPIFQVVPARSSDFSVAIILGLGFSTKLSVTH